MSTKHQIVFLFACLTQCAFNLEVFFQITDLSNRVIFNCYYILSICAFYLT